MSPTSLSRQDAPGRHGHAGGRPASPAADAGPRPAGRRIAVRRIDPPGIAPPDAPAPPRPSSAARPIAPVAQAVGPDADTGGCALCRHRSRYDNCLEPEAAGLSPVFRIVAHPRAGQGCAVWEGIHVEAGASHWRVRGPDGDHRDVVVVPPAGPERMRRLHPGATHIEPLRIEDPAER